VRVGIVGRANDRGLGVQSLNAWRNYPFVKALVVLDDNVKWPEYPQRYLGDRDVRVMHLGPNWVYNETAARAFLEGLDVVFTVEGYHDWRFIEWARDMGVKTVIQGNPEFFKHERVDLPHPDRWTWPTDWLLSELPYGPVIPVPSAGQDDCWATPGRPDEELIRVLHVAGHRASGDRNGTDAFYDGLRMVTERVIVRVVGQDGELVRPYRIHPHIIMEEHPHGLPDRWSMYDDVHLVVLPRQYGGNCMPAYEAMETGCALAMTDTPPNRTWPIHPLERRQGRVVPAPIGPIQTFMAKSDAIANAINGMARDRVALGRHQAASRKWAMDHTWEQLTPAYTALFEGVL
jgi:hypothetical protein